MDKAEYVFEFIKAANEEEKKKPQPVVTTEEETLKKTKEQMDNTASGLKTMQRYPHKRRR